jgi:hypothetical protein
MCVISLCTCGALDNAARRRSTAALGDKVGNVRPLMRKRTFLAKWALPYGLCALVALWQWYQELGEPDPHYLSLLVVWVMLFTILFFVIRRQSRNQSDEVLDGGTFIQLTFGKAVETVPLSNVTDIEVDKLLRLTRLVLHLREPSRVGQTIVFYPLQDKDSSGENSVAASLRARTKSSAHVA